MTGARRLVDAAEARAHVEALMAAGAEMKTAAAHPSEPHTPMKDTSMKIIRFEAENVKRLKAVEITPDGTVQVVTGRNGQGKSSVLDAIFLALGGGDAKKTVAMPIRDGETKASVRLDLGDLIVTRRWTESGTTLVVENADGSVLKSPQAVLDNLIGRLSFDPLAFVQLRPKEQVDALLALVDLPFVPAELDADRAALFAERTDVNRKVKDLTAQYADTVPVPADTPDEEVSATDLVAQINDATSRNAQIDQARTAYLAATREAKDLADRLAEAKSRVTNTAERLGALGTACDLAPLQEALAKVEDTNRDVREKQRRLMVKSTLEDAKAAAEVLSGRIEAIDKTKADGLAAAAFPVEGLGFDESGVTFNGVPFSQASSAEQIRVSLAMAMAANETLRVIRIMDGSLLDDDSMRLIAEMAAERDYQVWIERVGTDGSGSAVVIEDGQVQA